MNCSKFTAVCRYLLSDSQVCRGGWRENGESLLSGIREIKYSNYCICRDFVLYLGKRTNEAVKYPFTDDYRKRTDGKRKGN